MLTSSPLTSAAGLSQPCCHESPLPTHLISSHPRGFIRGRAFALTPSRPSRRIRCRDKSPHSSRSHRPPSAGPCCCDHARASPSQPRWRQAAFALVPSRLLAQLSSAGFFERFSRLHRADLLRRPALLSPRRVPAGSRPLAPQAGLPLLPHAPTTAPGLTPASAESSSPASRFTAPLQAAGFW